MSKNKKSGEGIGQISCFIIFCLFFIRFKYETIMLRNWYLYTILISLREWPSKDFGTLIDHFGSFAYTGNFMTFLV